DCTGLEQRARGMALIGAAFGIGFTFGPLLSFASFFVESKAAPGAAAALLSLTALLLAWFLLPETMRAGPSLGRRHWFGSLFEVVRMPGIGVLVMTFFLATVAFGSLESTLALMNQYLLTSGGEVLQAHKMSMEQLDDVFGKSSLIFAYVGFTLMLVQGLIYRRLVVRVGEARFMRMGALLMLVGLGGVVATVLAVAAHALGGRG